jgi:ABC-2 type transport system permease protein
VTSSMIGLTGTSELTRFIVRRDRVRILAWVLGIAALVAVTAASIKGLYPTQAALDQAAAASQGNAAAIAFNGPAQGLDRVGGEVAFQGGALGMVLVALMSVLMIGALTRGEEEAGRLELLRSLPVGSHAPAAAAALVVTAMNAAVAVLTALALLAQQLPVAGSITYGMSYLLVGVFFGGVAILAAQITENTRVVYGSAGAVLAAAFVLRAVGDIGNGAISWFSPIGLAQKTRPFAGERWWPFSVLIIAIAALAVATAVVAARRDLGGGLVAPRPGRSTASPGLGRPIGLAIRLQRGSLIGWSVGLLVAGVAYGSIAPSVDAFIGANKALADMMARAGGASLIDSYLATSFRVMALAGTGFAIQSVLRLRAEEISMRAEPVLATPVSRIRWAASHLAVAFSGSVIVLAVAGLATGVSYAVAGGGLIVVPRALGAALVYAPAMWLLVGLTVAIVGFAPGGVVTSWVVLAVCFVIGFLGTLLPIPHWLNDLSPFEHVPQLPAVGLTVLPLVVLTVIAAVFTLGGLFSLRRRDIG